MALSSLFLRRCSGAFAVHSRLATGQVRALTVTCWTDMERSKHDFVHFVKTAAQEPTSVQAKEMHVFLTKCFFDADTDYDGLVSFQGFNKMVAQAAAAPRSFGFAPHTRELYHTKEEFETARTKLFNEISKGNDKLSLGQWVAWAKPHIALKAKDLQEHNSARWERSKEDCISFFRGVAKAGSNHSHKTSQSTQLKEFYALCRQQFVEVDVQHSGVLGLTEFGNLLELSAELTNRFGLDWYAGVKFADVATNGGVTWDGWFNFHLQLVMEKASSA